MAGADAIAAIMDTSDAYSLTPQEPPAGFANEAKWLLEVDESAAVQDTAQPDEEPWQHAEPPPTSAPEITQEDIAIDIQMQTQEDPDTSKKKDGNKSKKGKEPKGAKLEALRQQKLQHLGKCSAGFEWDRRTGCFEGTCLQCGRSPNDGYQCQGGSHWVCIMCIDKAKV